MDSPLVSDFAALLLLLTFAALVVILSSYVLWLKHQAALNRKLLTQSEAARKSALDLVSQQQVAVNSIGKQIQECLGHETARQNNYLNQAFMDKDRRQSSRKNWNKIVKLSERLFHFTLRESERISNENPVYSSVVIAGNRALLDSISKSYQQNLTIFEHSHAILSIPSGYLDKVLRGAVHALLPVGKKGGELQMHVDTSSKGLHLRFESYGGGLSQQDVTKIHVSAKVAPQLHFSKRSQDNEEGLNLANIKRLVNELGGAIEIITAKNYSTRLFITLPKVGCDLGLIDIDKRIPIHRANKCSTFAKHSVLIVDVDDISQQQIHRALQNKFDCYACKKPLDTLQMIHNLSPDIVYLDQSTKGIGCIELIRLIRNNPQTRHLPIVVSSSLLSQSFKFAALKVGASQVIDKPIVSMELEIVLERLVQASADVAEQVGEEISKYHSETIQSVCSDDEPIDNDFLDSFNLMIAENYGNEAFTRELAAKHLNVTLRTLNRRLKVAYSHNFNEYLKKYRLEKGKALLLSGEQISDTAFSVGFSAPSYFSTCFRAEYGISPSQLIAKRA